MFTKKHVIFALGFYLPQALAMQSGPKSLKEQSLEKVAHYLSKRTLSLNEISELKAEHKAVLKTQLIKKYGVFLAQKLVSLKSSNQPCSIELSAGKEMDLVTFSPNGNCVMIAFKNGNVVIYDLFGKALSTFNHGHKELVKAIFSPDNEYILTIGEDKVVRNWDLDGNLIGSFKHKYERLVGIEYNSGATFILTSGDKKAHLWNQDGTFLVEYNHEYKDQIPARFSPSGDHVLTNSYGHHTPMEDDGYDYYDAKLWELSGKLVRKYNYMATFSPCGRFVVPINPDKLVKKHMDIAWGALTDLQGNKIIDVNCENIEFNSDNSFLLTHSNYKARMWDLNQIHLCNNLDELELEQIIFLFFSGFYTELPKEKSGCTLS